MQLLIDIFAPLFFIMCLFLVNDPLQSWSAAADETFYCTDLPAGRQVYPARSIAL
jgi:hypothetical protein